MVIWVVFNRAHPCVVIVMVDHLKHTQEGKSANKQFIDIGVGSIESKGLADYLPVYTGQVFFLYKQSVFVSLPTRAQ